MEVIKYKGEKIHVGCGGIVVKGKCLKCGEKQKGLLKRIFGDEPLIIKEKDKEERNREEHRKRIREGRDIFKC